MSTRGLTMDRKFVAELGDQYDLGTEPDLFGVEVELEGIKLTTNKTDVMKWWTNHQDHSLRVNKPGAEATEYVIKKPLTIENTRIAVMALFQHLTQNPGTEVFESYRTSIHVHVNCLQETNRTIANYITLAIIFDELFVSQNGEHRIGNNFCLRSGDAEGQLHELIKAVTVGQGFLNLHANYRYSSVNFASLPKFGTIEFRSLECTADYNRLLHWIDTIQFLKVKAREFKSPVDIMAAFSRKGPLGFMISMLGDQYVKYAQVPNNQQMLRNGMRLAQDFAYCSEWSGPQEVKDAPRRKGQGAYEAAYGQNIGQAYINAAPQAPQWGMPAPPKPKYGYNAYVANVKEQQLKTEMFNSMLIASAKKEAKVMGVPYKQPKLKSYVIPDYNKNEWPEAPQPQWHEAPELINTWDKVIVGLNGFAEVNINYVPGNIAPPEQPMYFAQPQAPGHNLFDEVQIGAIHDEVQVDIDINNDDDEEEDDDNDF